jgi:hypothetical protein
MAVGIGFEFRRETSGAHGLDQRLSLGGFPVDDAYSMHWKSLYQR